jgi:2-dehydropantoate 2-reductase
MRYLVLGAGALGVYFGAKLQRGGADVTFLVRPKRAAQLAANGLVLKSADGDIAVPAKTVQAGQLTGTYDVVLLCCKSYDLDDAIAAIAPAMGPDSVVLPFLNGMRHIDVLADRFGAGRVLGGLTAVNAALTPNGDVVQSPIRVNMTACGELQGAASARCAEIRRAFTAGGAEIAVSGGIRGPMWVKFFGFTTVAAVATMTRARAGVIARTPTGAALVCTVAEECRRVASAEGYPPPNEIADTIRGMFSQPASGYGPSILVDMEEGRTTEGEHTVGDMVARASRHGIPVPVLTAALCNLQAYEIARRPLPRGLA